MKKRKRKSRPAPIISVDDAIYTLRVSPDHFHTWRNEGRFQTVVDASGREFISTPDLKELVRSTEVRKAVLETFTRDMQRRQADKLSYKNRLFLQRTSEVIDEYRAYAAILEDIHASYHGTLDILGTDTPVVAAYLLYSKVISLLYMACVWLENLFWYSGILFRPIDETIDLAEYFIITADTEEGTKRLSEFFTENKVVPHSICRKAKSHYMNAVLADGKTETHELLLRELYGKKSKLIHPTHHAIMEAYRATIDNNAIIPEGFDYATCSYPRKMLELTLFFQSSIWSAVQGFFLCFHENMPLKEQHKELLLSLDKKFEKQADRAYYEVQSHESR